MRGASTQLKPRTKKRTARKETRAMARKPVKRETPPQQEAEDPTFEPEDQSPIDPTEIIVDIEQSRTPRSDNAKRIASEARTDEDLVEHIKRSRGGSNTVYDINPYNLYLEEGWNVRNFNTPSRRAYIAELAVSIAEIGVKEALLAYIKDGKVVPYSGYNRLLGTYHAIELGTPIMSVPVRFGKATDNEADRTLSQLVNNSVRSDLTPYEKGLAVKRMVNFGWSGEQIAKAIGKSITNVKGLLDLQALPMSLQELVANQTVSAFFATQTYGKAKENEEVALGYLQTAIENARAEGAKRVMPKHIRAPENEYEGNSGTRSGGRGRGRGRRSNEEKTNQIAPAESVSRLKELLLTAEWDKDEEDGTCLAQFSIEVGDEIAFLLGLPTDYAKGIEPVGEFASNELELHVDDEEASEPEDEADDLDGNDQPAETDQIESEAADDEPQDTADADNEADIEEHATNAN